MSVSNILTPGLVAISLLCSCGLAAQITDDFNDGNFTQNPAWTGDAIDFTINAAKELQLNAPDAGASALAVEGNIADSAVWQMDFRMEFAPSAGNLLRIYLLADQANLLQANGYFLEVGENGSLDALRFFRQDGAAKTLLASGVPGFVANEPVQLRLRVKRTKTGEWTIDAAAPGGAYQAQGTATDATYSGGANRFFGFYCLYTDTRKDKYFFDNLSVLPDIPDTKPPVLLGVQALNSNQVDVLFDEDLDAVSATDPTHFSIGGVGQPTSITFAPATKQTLRLNLGTPLNTGTHTLQCEMVADINGNESGIQTLDFQFVNVQPAGEFDLLINEIMASPTPAVGLPEVEWLEILNRSDKIIDLKTVRLSDGGAPQPLPGYLLYPGAFVALTGTAGAPVLLPVTAHVLAVPAFPALNNDADILTLSDASGAIIDQVAYLEDWHSSSDKRAGGWSLERIDPGLPCLGSANWQSCPVLPGGTPAAPNASRKTLTDSDPPQLLAVFPDSETSLRVFFSEGMDRSSVGNPAAFRLAPPRNILSASASATDRSVVTLLLGEPLQKSILYSLTLNGSVLDCSGNPASSSDTAYTGLPELPAPLDVVINEILFDPLSGGSDFVEFYNRSNKIISWQDFFVANFAGGADVRPVQFSRLLLPGQYAVFCPQPADIIGRFEGVRLRDIYSSNLPSLPDDAGNLTLYRAKDGAVVVLDSFDYSADYHNALLSGADREGVALERIRPEGPTNDANNWTSAARAIAGDPGTPTLPNSQLSSAPAPADGLVALDPARLSPDDDGYEDYLNIRYQLPAPGYAMTMTIFDSGGIPVKRLVRQELVGTGGAVRWDGDMDDGVRARPGIYILFLEIFAPNGDVQRLKKPFAVVQRF